MAKRLLCESTIAALCEFALVACRGRRLFRVRGESMEPTLHDGDYVLARPTKATPGIGEIVVAIEPKSTRHVVKRIRSRGNSTVALGSDNPTAGRDSRHYGSLEVDAIVGIVTKTWSPPLWLRRALQNPPAK